MLIQLCYRGSGGDPVEENGRRPGVSLLGVDATPVLPAGEAVMVGCYPGPVLAVYYPPRPRRRAPRRLSHAPATLSAIPGSAAGGGGSERRSQARRLAP